MASVATNPACRPALGPVPPLEAGDRLDQSTFHERYEAMPPGIRAELIGGVVHKPSPLQEPHGERHADVVGWLWTYAGSTPGTRVRDNATTILGPGSEPQPDAQLVILPAHGGQTRTVADGYVHGAPELVVEVASSTEAIDLHAKRDDYERAGVREYLVIALRQNRVLGFALRDGRFQETSAGPDGVFRSAVFPGLWLDPAALLSGDGHRLLDVLRDGLATPDHAAFCAALTAARTVK